MGGEWKDGPKGRSDFFSVYPEWAVRDGRLPCQDALQSQDRSVPVISGPHKHSRQVPRASGGTPSSPLA